MKFIICLLTFSLVSTACAESFDPSDAELHFTLSAWLAAGISAVAMDVAPEEKWKRRAIVFGMAIAPGIYKETQMDSCASEADMMANITGALFGIWVGEKFGKWAKRNRDRKELNRHASSLLPLPASVDPSRTKQSPEHP
jgi:hypothetical protein